MPLGQRREAFDHPDWFFELKYDGFRALACVDGGGVKLVSRGNIVYRRFDDLERRRARRRDLRLSRDH